jgi:hypothetical protein
MDVKVVNDVISLKIAVVVDFRRFFDVCYHLSREITYILIFDQLQS